MEESVGKSLSSVSIVEYLDKLCDYALSIGMPYDLYWYGDPQALKRYVNAEEIKQKKRNTELWLQGLYIYQAIGNLAPIFNPFSKDHKAKPYLKKPIALTEKEREEEEQAKMQRFIDYMKSLVKK